MGYTGWFQTTATHAEDIVAVAGAENVYNIATTDPGYSSDLYSERTRQLFQEWLANYAQPGEVAMGITVSHGFRAVLAYATAIEEAGSIDPDEVMKVFDDPNFRFDISDAENVGLGGFETYGIRRQFPHAIPYGEVISADDVRLSISQEVVILP